MAGALNELLAKLPLSIAVVAAVTAFELLLAKEKHTWASRGRGILLFIFYLLGLFIAALLFKDLMSWLNVKPLFNIDMRASDDSVGSIAVGYVVGPIISILVGDLLYYNFHRLQHVIPFLWKFHAVHHSIEELNALNSNHHLTEEFFKIPIIALPTAILFDLQVGQFAIVGVFTVIQAVLIHSSLPLSFGPLNYVVATSRYHRVHHSLQSVHHNKNFASLSPLWDIIFSTAYWPKKDEVIKTGLSEMHEPRSVGEYLLPRVGKSAR